VLLSRHIGSGFHRTARPDAGRYTRTELPYEAARVGAQTLPRHIGARAHGQFEAHTPSNEVGSQTRTREIREARDRAQRIIAEDVSASRRKCTASRSENREERSSREKSRSSSEGRRTSESSCTGEGRCCTCESCCCTGESCCCTGESCCGSGEDDGESRRSAGANAEARRRSASGTRARAGRRCRRHHTQACEQGEESRRACASSAADDD
jgi:hypothetical protein